MICEFPQMTIYFWHNLAMLVLVDFICVIVVTSYVKNNALKVYAFHLRNLAVRFDQPHKKWVIQGKILNSNF